MTTSAARSARSRSNRLTWLATGLCLLVIGVPLTVNAFGSAYRAGFQVVGLALGLLVLSDSRLASRLLAGRPRSVMLPFVALWVYMVARVSVTPDLPTATAQVLDRTVFLVLIAILASGMIGERRRIVVRAGLLGMAVVAAWGILQRLGIHPFLDPSIWEPSRPTRPLGTHNLMGVYLAAWLPVAYAVALQASPRRKMIWGTVALLGLACVLLSESRGAWLALIIALVIMLPWLLRGGGRQIAQVAGRDRRGAWILLGATAAVAIACMGSVVTRLGTPEQSGLLEESVSGPDGSGPVDALGAGRQGGAVSEGGVAPPASASALTSFERRKLVGQTALTLIGERPLFGHGTGSFRLAFYTARPPIMQRLEAETGETAVHAHSDPLELTAELGLLGFVLAAIGLMAAGRRALAAIDLRPAAAGGVAKVAAGDSLVAAGIVAGGLALGLHACVDFPLVEVPTALVGVLFLGLASGEWDHVIGRSKEANPSPPAHAAPVARMTVAGILVFGIAVALAMAAADRAYHRAYAELVRGKVEASEKWLERAMRWAPDRARDWVAYAEVARHRARLSGSAETRAQESMVAAERFTSAAELEPQIGARWQRAAFALDEARRLGAPASADSVRALAELALARNPYLGPARALEVRLARESGALDRAEVVLAAGEELVPGQPALLLERGRLSAATGDTAGALSAFALAARSGDVERAGAALDGMAEVARAGHVGVAREAEAILEGLAADDGLAASVRGGAARVCGDLAAARGDRELARRLYMQATATGGARPEAELGLGNLAYAEGRLDEAERHYRSALAGRPDMAEGWQNLGSVAMARRDTALALRLYRRAIGLAPGNAQLEGYIEEISGRHP